MFGTNDTYRGYAIIAAILTASALIWAIAVWAILTVAV